ncbi:MAG: ATP-binding cassette domain-containing protein [Lachnospiraceae bacterium]|nr:ATP-binding cassette domain-containing protein [Lachnospiraceae bacterium]
MKDLEDMVLQLKGIKKRYGSQQVLKQVDITIQKGQIYGLVGKNGAGKTTLMRILTGLTKQQAGSMWLLGEDGKNGYDAARKKMGSIIETPSFYPFFDGKTNLEYYNQQLGGKANVDEVLDLVGLGKSGKKKFKNYSLGMKQRLGIGLAILNDPDFLVLDEPINGLDPMGIVEVRNLIRKLNQERNITIIISSHILGELESIATNYGFLDKGIILEELSKEELEHKCRPNWKIRVNEPDKVLALIKEKYGFSQIERDEGSLVIKELLSNPEQLTREIVEKGYDLYEFAMINKSLESYYLDLIEDSKNGRENV